MVSVTDCAWPQQPSPWAPIAGSKGPTKSAEPTSPWAAISPQITRPPRPDAAGQDERVVVRHIELRGDSRRAEIVLTMARRTVVSAFALESPNRIVIDGTGFDFEATKENFPRLRMLVGAPRFGALTATTGRLLFDATAPVRVLSITGKPVGDAVQLTITVVPATQDQVVDAGTPVLWGEVVPPPATPAAAQYALPGSKNALPLVMIDPGHGGIDPGAVTDQGVFEKDVVLGVSLRLRSLLEARGRVQVAMTRQGDETVRLDQRVAAAAEQRANLFISLHADTYAGQGGASVRGGSIYVLGAQASNAAARALADKENTADIRAGISSADSADHAVDGILADLTVRETSALSHTLQDALVQSLRRSILLAREPARAAAFRVLKQAETPAVLIELGYMSNGQDVALLQSPEWQAAVAARIADAVDTFLAKPRGLALDR
jgi:N-acetylmuramoyl-L-alanine amidase